MERSSLPPLLRSCEAKPRAGCPGGRERKSALSGAAGSAPPPSVPSLMMRHTVAMARLLPTSFLTAQLLALDVTDDDALVELCNTYGPLVSPFAGSYDRMLARLADSGYDAGAYSSRASSRKPREGLLGGLIRHDRRGRDSTQAIDPISVGMDLWYDGLHSSAENTRLYEADLGLLKAFGHEENSML